MTSSTGWSGLILRGSPPMRFIASRIAARSTTQGTPVKSWRSTRLGVKAISWLGSAVAFHFARASMSPRVDGDAVLGAEEVLEEDLQREGQLRRLGVLLVDRVEPVDRVRIRADLQRRLAAEGVLGHWGGEYRRHPFRAAMETDV